MDSKDIFKKKPEFGLSVNAQVKQQAVDYFFIKITSDELYTLERVFKLHKFFHSVLK